MKKFLSVHFIFLMLGSIYPIQAQVVLSEIMFDAVGNDFHDEFVEIVNLGISASIDLTNWQITDGSGVDMLAPHDDGLLLLPGQFAVILDASYFANSTTYDEIIPADALIITIDNLTFGSSGLSNSTPETVSLLDASGTVVSEYTYSLGNNPGFSDEKMVLAGPNGLDNWPDSRVLFGTPGRRNSVSPLRFDVAVVPDDVRFSPPGVQDGDDVTISAVVRNVGTNPATDFTVQFYEDLNRNERGDLGEELGSPFGLNGELAPADSISFSIEFASISAGVHQIIVRAMFAADEDSSNNQALRQLLVGFSTQTMRINEIMYSPIAGSDEWVEILNHDTKTIDFNLWSISDSDTTTRILIDSSVVVAPGMALVLSEGSAVANIFDIPKEGLLVFNSFPTLNNTSDSFILYDPQGRVMDRVNYTSMWGGDSGVSLERINPEAASNDRSNWSSSVALRGATPGSRNSLFAQSLPEQASLTVEPNPFSPLADGANRNALIHYVLPVTTATVNIKIYDIRGRLIRFLVNNRPSGARNTVAWDGRTDDGNLARMGIYVVFLQALNARSGVLETRKKTVVLAKRL